VTDCAQTEVFLELLEQIILIWDENFPNDTKQLKKMCKQYLAIDPENVEVYEICDGL